MSEEKKAESLEELSRKLDLIMKRLDSIEAIFWRTLTMQSWLPLYD